MTPGPIEKLKTGISSLTNGTRKLKDPNNVESEITRGDLAKPDSEPAIGKIKDVIDLGNRRYEMAREGMYSHYGQFFEGIAYYDGKQDGAWDMVAGRMVQKRSRNPDLDEKFDRRTENVIQTVADQMAARLCAAWPDAWAAPLTDSKEDKQAAQIARAVNAHCKRETNLQRLIREAVLLMEISTTCFIESSWNNKAWADVGLPQPDGTIKYKRAQIGDVEHSLIMAIDAYPDPAAAYSPHGIHGGNWFITRTTRTVEWIKEKWGKTVQATCSGDTHGYLRQRLSWIANDYNQDRAKLKNATEETRMWEKPSTQYPHGRFVVWSSDGTLLYGGPWPYECKTKFPFTAFRYRENIGSVWGLNYVAPMLGIQTDLNDLATYLSGRMMWDRPVLLRPSASHMDPEAVTMMEYGNVIDYKSVHMGGDKPEWFYPSPPGDFWFKQEQRLMAKLAFISGIHEFNSDGAVTINSAKEYELRLEEDKSRTHPILDHISEGIAEIQQWEVELYRQYGAEFPRLLGLDDKQVPAKALEGPGAAAAAMVDLQGLRNGQCRVVYVPGSGIARLPAARQEELLELCKAMIGMPAPVVEFLLTQLQAIRSDQDVDRFLAAYKVYEQQQSQQALQVQQMKGQQAQQENEQKAQAEETREATAVHSEALKQHLRVAADAYIENLRTSNKIAEMQASTQNAPKVSVGFQVKPDPEMTQELGKKFLGVEGDVAMSKQMLITPKPAPGQQKESSSGPK